MNNEMAEFEALVQGILTDIRSKREWKKKENQKALEKATAARQEKAAAVNEQLRRINVSLQQMLECSPTIFRILEEYSATRLTPHLIALRQIATSEGVFSASIGLVKLLDGNCQWTWTVAIRKVLQVEQDYWYPLDAADYDHMVMNYQLELSELENMTRLACAILEKVV